MAFRVGQKVVCVDASRESNDGTRFLTCGGVYEIRWIGMFGPVIGLPDRVCLRFVEINRGEGVWNAPKHVREAAWDMPYRASRFRPVVSTESGMAIFEQIRRDVTNKELRPIFDDATGINS